MILGIESSCDETALAAFDPARGLVGEWVHSQMALHGSYGGVVPDLASREHLHHFGPLLGAALREIDRRAVTTLAVTQGPGLAACLAMGLAVAKALAIAWRVPVVPGNHLRGHAWSPFLPVHAASLGEFASALAARLPHLGLIVSGGNTLLLRIERDRQILPLASTRDDAAGEALDKGAKLLGLGYPGGPAMEENARGGDPAAFDFPRGLVAGADDFSFSGLKTSLRYTLEKMDDATVAARLADLCAGYQAAVVEALARRVREALAGGGYRSLGVSGGVANNRVLRAALAEEAQHARVEFLPAEPRHTGDNAAMIAFAVWADGLTENRDAASADHGAVTGAPGASSDRVFTAGLALGIEPALELATVEGCLQGARGFGARESADEKR
jgi:N6-L-threonylcarbamoyladenine synthase